ncbi:P-loop NTPase fold protein [Brevibacillus sp. MS2.2]|uniref:KAP family P-loop NTPase fold protein n=1 Tax=Brevibacillus sp. MS2.2 TaxID=2738981 RepID=UPI00156B185B|nr:P-loop NTPase fold protein [Brevibacillus sp. MS2.2]NRR20213.1 NTPase [Brevibacillus sp. MS2.2]
MAEPVDAYSSDAPIKHPDSDVFKRWPFAQRVAQVIATRRDRSSIVIGINGAWGEGKTSVLNFIQHELSQHPHVVCIKFNPWRFGDEEQLLKGFFFDLASSIDRSLSTSVEKVGDLIKRFGKPFASLTGHGEAVENLGNMLSSADLENFRERIEKILDEQEQRVVILVDDIDRLEKSEIHAIFRLVKLTADFKNTAYVLAFDHEMVAAALQDRYGSGQQNAGKAFLEKIIQVPLQLPAVDKVSLRKYCFSGVDEALSQAGIVLKEDEVQLFVRNFTYGLEARLSTPRQAKLYGNILTFSLPILKGEVNNVDIMLIEGVRVFYPKLYDVIRRNTSLFLSVNRDYGYGHRNEERKEKVKQLISSSLVGFSNDDVNSVQELLSYLFPRLQSIYSNTHYGSDWENSWAAEKRICSKSYATRYFSYTVPQDDISDQQLEEFISKINRMSIDEVTLGIAQIVNHRNAEAVISKLRQQASDIPVETSIKLAHALVVSAQLYPNPEALFSFLTPFSRSAMLVGDLVSNIDKKDARLSLAIELVLSAEPLTFGLECLRWFIRDKEDSPNPRGFTSEDLDVIGKRLARRIGDYKGGPATLINEFHSKVTPLFNIWRTYGDEGEVNTKFLSWFEENLENVTKFLLCYVPTAWEMESGLSHKADFEINQYQAVSQVIDPEIIIASLKRIYNDLLFVEQYPIFTDTPLELKTAQQFVWLHKTSQQMSENTEEEEFLIEEDN